VNTEVVGVESNKKIINYSTNDPHGVMLPQQGLVTVEMFILTEQAFHDRRKSWGQESWGEKELTYLTKGAGHGQLRCSVKP
jgi:hypothetical protein